MIKKAEGSFWYHRCSKCGYIWYSKASYPSRCTNAQCRSPWWNSDGEGLQCNNHMWTQNVPTDLTDGVKQFRFCRRCKFKEEVRFEVDTKGNLHSRFPK